MLIHLGTNLEGKIEKHRAQCLKNNYTRMFYVNSLDMQSKEEIQKISNGKKEKVEMTKPLCRLWKEEVGIKVSDVKELMPSMSTMVDIVSEKEFRFPYLVYKKSELINKCLNIAERLQIANFKDKVIDLDIQKITQDIKKKLIDEDKTSESIAKNYSERSDEQSKEEAKKIRAEIRKISGEWKKILANDFEDLVGTPELVEILGLYEEKIQKEIKKEDH